MAYRLEARLYRRSVLVSGQTQGICKNIQARFPKTKTWWLPNGVDLSFYDPSKIDGGDWRTANGFSAEDKIFLYAGIIGIAQGLEVILEAAAQLRTEKNLKFVLLGSGPEKEKLQKMKEALKLHAVYFMEPVSKTSMPGILKSVNATIVPLKKLDLFLGAIPSKIFECLAMELPLLLGVNGEAKELFIDQGKCGYYFEPENSTALAAAIRELSRDGSNFKILGKRGRDFVHHNFNRENIAANFLEQLKALHIG